MAMIRFLFRSLGFLLLASAFAALVVDGTRSIAGGRLLLYSLADTGTWLGAARLAAAAGLPEAPAVLQRLGAGLLGAPGWVVAGLVGLALLHAGRPRLAPPGLSGRRA